MSVETSHIIPDDAGICPADQRVARQLAEIVSAAGALALDMSRAGIKTWTKDDSSPVTEADLAVDRFLRDALSAIAPEWGWLSEETADNEARLSARRIWIVDPIDGTRGFMSGAPDWAVSAALVENGVPILGALFAPVTGELFTAMRGGGARRNGALLRATQRDTLSGAAAIGPADALDALEKSAPITRLPRGHSLALRIARVATGEVDIALSRANSHDWDLAAADILVREAGGQLTTYDGLPVRYNAPSPRHAPLISAGTGLHGLALAAARTHSFPQRQPDKA
ncbi:3'(2'),5'-bisphosphate nucleotidase CysQ [Xanthobacter sp. TB0136]|uniref:3'(2'),5'-bisphosphate nucleotidase CysQ n=1 Tax=Xanthobacter sp. TB0136 TaxID=3459177 RepID=UPI00403941EF